MQPVAIVRPAPITNLHQYCLLNVTSRSIDVTNGSTTPLDEKENNMTSEEKHKTQNVIQPEERKHCMPRELWICVFTHLDKTSLNRCMSVCKAWNQWCLDHRLWAHLRVSNTRLMPSVLKGIVRRQPGSLALPSTSGTAKQVEWLLNRLPRLHALDLSLNTAAAVSSLLHVQPLPPLLSLDLSWCEAVYDRFLAQVFGPLRVISGVGTVTHLDDDSIGCSRLRSLESLTLCGCDVAYETMNTIFTMLPCLRHLDISYCLRVKDNDFAIVAEGKNVNKICLRKIVCVGCPLVTDDTEVQVRSLPNAPVLSRS